MLKLLKIIRSILVNIGIIGVSVFALIEGADPTSLGLVTIATLGLYNGVELADYVALVEAFNQSGGENNEQ